VDVNAPENTQALPPGTRLEEFVIERVLGSGGFGITYLARDTSLDRQVVIKENLPVQFAYRHPESLTVSPRHSTGEDAENFAWSLENFSKEATLLASLDHHGIVKVLRSFRAFGTAFFVMPYVEGVPLDELIRSRTDKGKSFTAEEISGLLERVLGALAYLHDRGIYHRDIKPGNILITNDGIPVLIDFGSARQRLSERSMTVVESPGYTPFEQLQGRGNVGPWSDLYALGATVSRAITGETLPKATDRVFDDPWVPLAQRPEIAARLPTPLLASIDKALRPRDKDRWQDARHWVAVLSYNPDSDAPPAKPESLPGQPQSDFGNADPKPATAPSSSKSKGKQVAIIAVAAICFLIGTIAWASHQAKTKSLSSGEISKSRSYDIGGGERIVVKYVPGGRFQMGSPQTEANRRDDENQASVTLSNHYWMGETEVTQGQWQVVMGSNPSHFKGADWKRLPVENVSWNDAQAFIAKLNETHPPGKGWKWALPTEAQWERACRGGTTTATAFGDSLSSRQATFNGNDPYGEAERGPFLQRTVLVKSYQRNAYGLHDMHGNVWEWCEDSYQERLPGGVDPLVSAGQARVIRGGSWGSYGRDCRSAIRVWSAPDYRDQGCGFRLAAVPAGRAE